MSSQIWQFLTPTSPLLRRHSLWTAPQLNLWTRRNDFQNPFPCFQGDVFRLFCPYVWLVFKSGLLSRAGYNGTGTVDKDEKPHLVTPFEPLWHSTTSEVPKGCGTRSKCPHKWLQMANRIAQRSYNLLFYSPFFPGKMLFLIVLFVLEKCCPKKK